MKTFPLPSGEFLIVDDEDADRISNLTLWRKIKRSGQKYVFGTCTDCEKPKIINIARLVMGETTPKMFVDHINGDGLDNRKENLRVLTNRQNVKAFQRKRKGTSRFRGVSWKSREKKWCAQAGGHGDKTWIGYFETEEEAAAAYNKRALEIGYFK